MATSTVLSAELVRVDDPLNFTEPAAIAGFLARYNGNTLVSYTTDLRLFAEWCTNNDLRLLDVRRAHLEIFSRATEADGRMRSTVARRLSTLGSCYRYRHVEGILEGNPAANVGLIGEPERVRAGSPRATAASASAAARAGSTRHSIRRAL